MKSIVIYGSRFGNTRSIAEAIAGVLHTRGEVQLLPADEAPVISSKDYDLLVIGGPTEVHKMTPPLAHVLGQMESNGLDGVSAAAFDTRIRTGRWLSGSAASGISRKLRRLGARVIVPEESFFVAGRANPSTGETPKLEFGELQRARVWAEALANMVDTTVPRTMSETK